MIIDSVEHKVLSRHSKCHIFNPHYDHDNNLKSKDDIDHHLQNHHHHHHHHENNIISKVDLNQVDVVEGFLADLPEKEKNYLQHIVKLIIIIHLS